VRLVLDTNVVVSALVWGGTPYKLLQAATVGGVELVTSPALLAELRGVLAREHHRAHPKPYRYIIEPAYRWESLGIAASLNRPRNRAGSRACGLPMPKPLCHAPEPRVIGLIRTNMVHSAPDRCRQHAFLSARTRRSGVAREMQ